MAQRGENKGVAIDKTRKKGDKHAFIRIYHPFIIR